MDDGFELDAELGLDEETEREAAGMIEGGKRAKKVRGQQSVQLRYAVPLEGRLSF